MNTHTVSIFQKEIITPAFVYNDCSTCFEKYELLYLMNFFGYLWKSENNEAGLQLKEAQV